MTKFERWIYAEMRSVDRAMLWMMKCSDLLELSKIMKDEDIKMIEKAMELLDEHREEETNA